MKLLIVDDSRLALKLLADQLALLDGVDELAQAETGEEAVSLLDSQPFDLVITDLVMPGLTGMDVLAAAGRLQPGCLVIVLTGYASVDAAVDAMRAGAFDFVEKPVNINLLNEKLDNAREYLQRTHEADDYRLAKEVAEADAANSVQRLEFELAECRRILAQAARLAADNAIPDSELRGRLVDLLAGKPRQDSGDAR
jgi:DNA-binding NtrC family response regulator